MLNVSEGFHLGIILCFSRINVEYVFGDREITEGLSKLGLLTREIFNSQMKIHSN